MQDQVEKALEEALKGTKQLVVTFKKEAIPHLIYLWRMIFVEGQIQVSRDDQENLEAIRKTRNWFNDDSNSRTLVITLTNKFNKATFIDRLGRNGVLQHIAVAK